MKKIIVPLLLITILIGCKTTQKVRTFENVLYPEGRTAIIRQVDESNQRWFDFYFMEAIRQKAVGDYGKSAMYYREAINNDPTCAICYYELANLLYYSGDAKNAEAAAFRAVQLDPQNEWYILFLSRVFYQNKKIDLALSSAKYLVEIKPNNYEYIYNLSQMEVSAGKYIDAITSINKIEKIIGANEYINLERHSIYMQAGDFKNAENEIQKLIKQYPSNYDYRVYLGDFYAQRENLKSALEEYKKVLNLDPNNGPVNFSLANYYLITDDSTNFKKYLKNAFGNANIMLEDKIQRLLPFLINMNDVNNPIKTQDFEDIFKCLIESHKDEEQVYVLYGNFLNHNNQRKKAAETFETALLIDEKQEDVWNDFLFLAIGEYEDSLYLEKCINAVNAFPENPVFNFLTAAAYSQLKEYSQSIEYLNQTLKYNKNNDKLKEQTYGMLGDFYYKIGEVEKSFENYEKALEIDGHSIIILNNYAYYLSLEGKNLDKAERMISKTIEFEPFNPTYLDTYAWVLFKRERYFEAVFVMEQALKFNDEPSGVLFEHYGDILYMNGDKEKAIEYWIKASEKDDEDISDKLMEKIEKGTYIK